MTDGHLGALLRSASLAEVSWASREGPVTRGTIALVDEDRPVLALTYAERDLAHRIAAAPEVVLTLTEPRGTGRAFAPRLLRCHPRLEEDPSGDRFTAGLLADELRRYPPARLLADSLLLQREHWWYLPRLLVHLEVASMEPVPARDADAGDHLLVTQATAQRVEVHPARVEDTTTVVEAPAAGGRTLAPVPLTAPGPAAADAAVLFGQDASFPDLEQWTQWTFRGTWDGRAFVVTEAPGHVGLAPPAGLAQRWRRHRRLARECRRGLADAGH